MKWPSPNFAFLEPRDPLLHGYASRAERYFSDHPNGSLVKMRQFAEALAHPVRCVDDVLGLTPRPIRPSTTRAINPPPRPHALVLRPPDPAAPDPADPPRDRPDRR